MNILFHIDSITERGGTLSRIRLLEANEEFLGNKSLMACPKSATNDLEVLKEIESKFNMCLYSTKAELDAFIGANNVDWIYYNVHGEKRPLPSEIRPTFVHAVFTTKSPFGDLYSPISPWLNHHNRTNFPVLPLIVPTFSEHKANLRERLVIPDTATVFGGIGGRNSFNIPFAIDAVKYVAGIRKDIYFVFVNFEKFCDLSNVIFLAKNTNLDFKEYFINTCDAMLHARSDGETFGMACAEFSVKNRPVVSWKPGRKYYGMFSVFYALRKFRMTRFLPNSIWGIRPLDSYAKAHLEFLGEKAITYTTHDDLVHLLTHFSEYKKFSNYDCYSERFSAKNVMNTFNDLLQSHRNIKQGETDA